MLIGPHSTRKQRDEFRNQILASPRNYIAQPTLAFSRAACFMDSGIDATSTFDPTCSSGIA